HQRRLCVGRALRLPPHRPLCPASRDRTALPGSHCPIFSCPTTCSDPALVLPTAAVASPVRPIRLRRSPVRSPCVPRVPRRQPPRSARHGGGRYKFAVCSLAVTSGKRS